VDHVCLRIEQFDQDALVRHLEANGARVGEIGQRFGADGTGPSMYVHDPEGNVVELKGPPAG
jgi:glyoxylase I family protein